MDIYNDTKGQRCFDVANMRITVRRPAAENDWAGTGRYLSFRAYTSDGKPMQGAEIPIRVASDDDPLLEAVGAVLRLISPE